MDNQITVNDIVQFKNILEICSQRGAFQASEMEVVGGLYNRVKSFTDEVEAKAREQKSENENAPLESVPEEQEHQDILAKQHQETLEQRVIRDKNE